MTSLTLWEWKSTPNPNYACQFLIKNATSVSLMIMSDLTTWEYYKKSQHLRVYIPILEYSLFSTSSFVLDQKK